MNQDKTPLRLDDFLPYRLSVASNAVSNKIAEAYRKKHRLKVTEWRVLAILAERGRLTPNRVGELTRMDKISVSRAAAVLEARGIVSTHANPADGRSHLLSLTETGNTLYQQIVPVVLECEEAALAQLTVDERKQLNDLLRRVEQSAQSSTHSERG